MGRKNRRFAELRPVDMTPAEANRPAPPPLNASHREAREHKARQERERRERQVNARINGGIDWSVCLVPECGEALYVFGSMLHHDPAWRDHTVALPLCTQHLIVASHQAKREADDPFMRVATQALVERRREVAEERREDIKAKHLSRRDGQIYYIRLNGLVKVGWSRDFYLRLKAYGPDVEVLCHYPATRDDETTLHRQLRPALARGREWYHDGDIIRMFLDRAIAEHGEPQITSYDWTSPRTVVAGKRATRARR